MRHATRHSTFRNHKLHGVGGSAEYVRPPQFGILGQKICLQRRSLFKFADVRVTEMWFCYLPEDQWANCTSDIAEFRSQGMLMIIIAAVLIGILSYTIQNQTHFLWALSWVARFVVNLELGVASVASLIHVGADRYMGPIKLDAIALIFVMAGSNLILIPYTCCRTRNCGHGFAVFWLLVLVIFPVVAIDWASFVNPFPLVVSHWPILLGLLGFGTEWLKQYFCQDVAEGMLTCTVPASSMQQGNSKGSSKSGMTGFSKSGGIDIRALESAAVKYDLHSPNGKSRTVWRDSAEDESYALLSLPRTKPMLPFTKAYTKHVPLCPSMC